MEGSKKQMNKGSYSNRGQNNKKQSTDGQWDRSGYEDIQKEEEKLQGFKGKRQNKKPYAPRQQGDEIIPQNNNKQKKEYNNTNVNNNNIYQRNNNYQKKQGERNGDFRNYNMQNNYNSFGQVRNNNDQRKNENKYIQKQSNAQGGYNNKYNKKYSDNQSNSQEYQDEQFQQQGYYNNQNQGYNNQQQQYKGQQQYYQTNQYQNQQYNMQYNTANMNNNNNFNKMHGVQQPSQEINFEIQMPQGQSLYLQFQLSQINSVDLEKIMDSNLKNLEEEMQILLKICILQQIVGSETYLNSNLIQDYNRTSITALKDKIVDKFNSIKEKNPQIYELLEKKLAGQDDQIPKQQQQQQQQQLIQQSQEQNQNQNFERKKQQNRKASDDQSQDSGSQYTNN